MAKRSENQGLFNLETPAKPQGPVECLGMTFENDEARREHFLGLLREGLEELHAKLGGVPFTTVEDAVERMRSVEKWPMGDDARLRELAERMRHADSSKDLLQRWKDEVGFPHGEIEDILNLSDPPYYTACPNPFIADFIKHYGKPYDPNVPYSKEPFAADVSEGRYSPETLCHSYHTKVPARAIVRYLLHFTSPGDVILDGFCGTGMTGVATHICSNPDPDFRGEIEAAWKELLGYLPQWGKRSAILVDLSPAASFISHNYNLPVDTTSFAQISHAILEEVTSECSWMYETIDPNTNQIGTINYCVWSDVFFCPDCAKEVVFWDAAADMEKGRVRPDIRCPHCNSEVSKRNLERVWVREFDDVLGRPVERAKSVPVLINYTVGGKRFNKKPDQKDLDVIARVKKEPIPYRFPVEKMVLRDGVWGDQWRAGYHKDVTHAHHYYTRRNLRTLASFWEKASVHLHDVGMGMLLTATALKLSRLSRYMFDAAGRIQNGVLYIPSLHQEMSPLLLLRTAVRYIARYRSSVKINRSCAISCGSTTNLSTCPSSSVDYIFTDPPFGDNLKYSELNFLWEAWLRLYTNVVPEAVESKIQKKRLLDYQELMVKCFQEYYRILKPGRWLTVEFHNSRNAVWNAIQEALIRAGFVVADVRALDKKQGAFNQVVAAGAVKQDLVISAYKPNGGLEERFKLTAGTEEGVWDFVRTHLKQLPVFVSKDGKAEVIAERQNYLLFDRMVAFHVQRGVTVPLSAAEFYAGLAQRFPERDGMYFLPEQVAEYDKKRMKVKEVLQLQLFVTDEASAIQWLKQQLTRKPQTFQELHPQFLKEIGGWQKHEKQLELSELLEQNFLRYDGKGEVPSQIHSYLSSNFKELRNLPKDDERLRAKAKDRWYVPDPNKAGDLEKLRERALLREFEEYRQSKQKRLKVFRLEAVRAGFKKAWQERDYATIIAVARKIPENVLQEDPKLLMWYDQALTRSGEDG
jgi:DNA-directed RNA polymerase subunit RPC12/RpoP